MHHLPHSASSTPLPPNYPLLVFFQLATQGLAAMGTNISLALSEAASLEKYGFVNIRHESFRIPIGTWPLDDTLKTVGMYVRWGIEDGLQAMAYGPLCRGLGWSRERVEAFLIDIRACLTNVDEEVDGGKVNAYLPFHIWCGQKPFDAKEGGKGNDGEMEADEAMDLS
jgi:hypothetical protein